MRNKLLLDGIDQANNHTDQQIYHSIASIQQKLDEEIQSKQQTIERQEEEIRKLFQVIEDKNTQLASLSARLHECQQNSEGSKQLINKLLQEIDHLKQDIEWYKRTYEKRSLLGTIKEKLFSARS
jgi:chromosome segregation ATPase